MKTYTNYFTPPILIIFLFINLGCPDDGVQPPTNPLQISIVDASCTEAILKLTLADDEPNRTVTLKRGDSSIATITMTGNDSLFVDEKLQPKKTYTYTLVKDNWNVSVQATTQDTTLHNVQWQLPDTLGAQGLIRDVWVFSKTDAWAVGEIYLRDSTGKIDNANPYNAAHWDGIKWKLIQIPTAGFVGSGNYPIYTIFAFAPTDIWTFSDAGSYSHWDGQKWTTSYVSERSGGGMKLWGTSSSNLYLVGTNGSISLYNGSVWKKLTSGTTVDLQDIWGIDETHIWATGTTVSDGHSVVLQYNGAKWITLYDSNPQPFQTKYQFMTLWTDTPTRIYIDGGSWLRLMNLSNYSIGPQINTGRTYTSVRLRGGLRNDIFNVGPIEVAHYNGYSWFRYSEPEVLYNEAAGFSNVFPTNDFVLIGGYFFTGLNGIPVVVRGYR